MSFLIIRDSIRASGYETAHTGRIYDCKPTSLCSFNNPCILSGASIHDNTHSLYLKQFSHQKARLLRIAQSNCTWDGLTSRPIFKKPFGRLFPKGFCRFGSSGRTRTCDHSVNSRTLYQLSYRGTNILRSSFSFK